MIDARDQLLPSSSSSARRRQAAVSTSRTSKGTSGTQKSLRVQRVFSDAKVKPFDQIEWDKRTAEITDDSGKVIFKQENVEVPKSWSVLATKVVVSKYFYGEQHTPERETSVRQLIHRICRTIADWGVKDGYFSKTDGEVFFDELTWLCVNQYGAFNSPVWFNVGLYHQYGVGKNSGRGNWFYNRKTGEAERAVTQYEYPQGSACFIQSVEDNMEDIMHLAYSEAMLFKYGSGTGTDLSPIRSSREKLSGGGRPSGPLSFLKVYDQVANVVKSGGKTRRAAKMNTLRDWHGDIEEFIDAKQKEEKKAWALIEQGFDGSYNGEAYGSVMYQNENLSVRVSDAFMTAAEAGTEWWTKSVTGNRPLEKKDANKLMHKIAEGTWICGDPGLQYDDAIQKWHTCKGTEPIHSTNPCSEYVFLNNTACNLASLNLMKFKREDGVFDVERFKAAVRIYITAQEIIVDNASYPTKQIAENSHIYRTLGLGYANLGSLIMSYGLAYDSDGGRALAGAITAIMTGHAYEQSAEVATSMGAFKGYHDARCAHVSKPIARDNVESMLGVIKLHRDAVEQIQPSREFHYLKEEARKTWDRALERGQKAGYRNAQVTVLAPTGTIAFLMDCDTTGVEPDIALVKYKLLAGGGLLKLVNRTVPEGLRRLGYGTEAIQKIVAHVEKYDTIEDVQDNGQAVSSGLRPEHLEVFDCAFKPYQGKRSIKYMAHLKMMGAAQPFISGAISKTVNLPQECTVEDIRDAYVQAWKMGLKCVAIYRDGSKRSQPLNTKKNSTEPTAGEKAAAEAATLSNRIQELESEVNKLREQAVQPLRRRLPDTRTALTHKFDIAGHEGYLTVGLFEDGQPGELFITMAKEGSTIGGLMDSIGTLTSIAFQYGVPLEALVRKFAHQRFEPSGFTKNPEVRNASSITDYVFRWMAFQFIPGYREANTATRNQPELAIPGLLEELKKKINRPVPELPLSEDTDILDMKPAETNGNGHGHKHGTKAITSLSDSVAHFQQDAPTCPSCGHVAVRNGACYKCLNCGESLGCS
ncbi:vitamin B12-dependent ribonucleotide reductase [Pedosphaera parvula]|uniref:Vitamin B12-dependent ribonucleotide reductase n=1 Tax=Pedosphaera parvula (strain Ellin514) TaxID=320771 RepID=B9XIX8_PEDPL|nr:vitamin B12-dependent ribonucleotide reductase [Pedosphaera parvula]EEF60205.1 ribonucleoside-diphosphate reductase, adenosylcobalamin-dependent [Pedosphaera parvula Ellin514]